MTYGDDEARPLHWVQCEEAVRYFDMANTLFLVLDLQGRVQQVNQCGSELLKVPRSELIGTNWFDRFVPEARRPEVEAVFERLWQGEVGDAEHFENLILTRTGEERCIRWSNALLYDERDRATGVLALGEDVTDLKRHQQDLVRLASYRELILRLSSRFIRVPANELSQAIHQALSDIGEFMRADRAYIFEYDLVHGLAVNTHEWCGEDVEPQMENLKAVPLADMPDWLDAHQRGERIVIPSVADLEEGAVKETLLPQGIQSLVAAPIMSDGACTGFVGIDLVCQKSDFDDREPELISLFAELLSSVASRQNLEEKLLLSDRVFEASPYAIMVTDADYQVLSVNPAFEQMTGYALNDVQGKTAAMLSSGVHDAEFYHRFDRSLKEDGVWEGEIHNRRRNGEIYPQWLTVQAVDNHQTKGRYFIVIGYDLTEKKAQKQLIERLSHYDPLTGLPNLLLLKDRIDSEISAYPRHGESFALVGLDLDNFAVINDAYGLSSGDRVIQRVAEIIRLHLREQDTLCHQSGDEYFLLLPETQVSGALKVVEKLLKILSSPLCLDSGECFNMTASAGIAIYPDDGHSYYDLVKASGIALHRAKQLGKNSYEFYTREQQLRIQESTRVENELHHALTEDELLLYFQPQYEVGTEKLLGAEALIRWQHPKLGMMPPGHFIPVAEKSHLILDIGRWVIDTAIAQLVDWRKKGLTELTLAINLSAAEFRRTDLPRILSELLAESGLPPEVLEIEMTETVAMEDSDRTLSVVTALHQLGVKLALDDFGTGYSSLSYLSQFEIDKLKIDQSFVAQIGQHVQAETIVDAVIQMARSFGYQTLAEGVETQAQYEYLKQQGCNQIQGFYFSQPLPAHEFEQLLLQNR
ncbi:sensor domain-containing protein [Hydrogenovibrio halophilus]|uniref:sensor domain-containing protein n=1 Tax=Hydrogenovibrio halophilus TaxID=373391 RepID=UPI000365EB01|nr:GGDEF domain-containing phosphodiesterase [Hydrogenovibrio halophilus]